MIAYRGVDQPAARAAKKPLAYYWIFLILGESQQYAKKYFFTYSACTIITGRQLVLFFQIRCSCSNICRRKFLILVSFWICCGVNVAGRIGSNFRAQDGRSLCISIVCN